MAELAAARNNALPYPVYGVAYTVTFPLFDATGAPISPSSPDSEISKNCDTFTDCTNEAVEIASGSGSCYLVLTAAEMTSDILTVQIKSSGANTTVLTLYPRKLPILSTGTCQGSNDTGDIQLASGDSDVDDTYNGCLCVAVIDGVTEARIINDYVGSTKVGEVSPAWSTAQPDSSDTYTIYQPEGRFVSPELIAAIASQMTAVFDKLPSKPYLAGTDNSDGDLQFEAATGNVEILNLGTVVASLSSSIIEIAAVPGDGSILIGRQLVFGGNQTLVAFISDADAGADTITHDGGYSPDVGESVWAIIPPVEVMNKIGLITDKLPSRAFLTGSTSADGSFIEGDSAQLAAIFAKLPSKDYLAGTDNADGDVQLNEATGDVGILALGTVVASLSSSVIEIADVPGDGSILIGRQLVFGGNQTLVAFISDADAGADTITHDGGYSPDVGETVWAIIPPEEVMRKIDLVTDKLPSSPYLTGTDNADGSTDEGSVSESSDDFSDADRTKLEAIYAKLPSKSRITGTNNGDGDIQLDEATGSLQSLSTNALNSIADASLNVIATSTIAVINTQLEFEVAGLPTPDYLDLGGLRVLFTDGNNEVLGIRSIVSYDGTLLTIDTDYSGDVGDKVIVTSNSADELLARIWGKMPPTVRIVGTDNVSGALAIDTVTGALPTNVISEDSVSIAAARKIASAGWLSLGTVTASFSSTTFSVTEPPESGNHIGRQIIFEGNRNIYPLVVDISGDTIQHEGSYSPDTGEKVWLVITPEQSQRQLNAISAKLPSGDYLAATDNPTGELELGELDVEQALRNALADTELNFTEETLDVFRDHLMGGKLYIESRVNASDVTPTTTSFAGYSDDLDDEDDFYSKTETVVAFTTGRLAGRCNPCVGYDGATRTFLFDLAWPVAPDAEDKFILLGRITRNDPV